MAGHRQRERGDATAAVLRAALERAGVAFEEVRTKRTLDTLWRAHGNSRLLIDNRAHWTSPGIGNPLGLRPPFATFDDDEWIDGELPDGGRGAFIGIEPLDNQPALVRITGVAPPGMLRDIANRLIVFTEDWLLADGLDDHVIARGPVAIEWQRRRTGSQLVSEVDVPASALPASDREALRSESSRLDDLLKEVLRAPVRDVAWEDVFHCANARLLVGGFVDLEVLVEKLRRHPLPRPRADEPLSAMLARRLPAIPSDEPPRLTIEVPDPWFVTYNELYDVNPDVLSPDSSLWSYLVEDLVQIEGPDRLLLDVGWYPDGRHDGQFVVVLIRDLEWQAPIERHEKRTTSALLRTLEDVMRRWPQRPKP